MNFCSKNLPLVLAVFLFLSVPSFAADGAENVPAARHGVRILFEGGEAVAVLYDTPPAEAFLRLLPLEVEFSDFAGAEKIFYLAEKLPVRGTPNADEQKGDFCYYAPWGNIAVFYKGYGHGKNLYVLGSLASGKEKLAAMKQDFKARIEVLEEGKSNN
ncbi:MULTISPECIES: cyclophilin-like fold protein [unclassified Desulfovibrio]|uniref:cyclophilin-like fold protein n=1 Tax=unclassified Desulfovibrio TaxID=2593640 RepID=UPI0013EA3B87|nr:MULTISPECIES: cyclophilin-like fold protein [unclassified Desulfovibrio]